MTRYSLAFVICAALSLDLTHAQESTPSDAKPAETKPAESVEPRVQTRIESKPAAAPRKSKAAATPVSAPAPAPVAAAPSSEKPGFWKRVFGRKKVRTPVSPATQATPAPKATPAPAPKKAKPAPPKPAAEKPAVEKPEKPTVEKPAPEKPAEPTPKPAPKATPKPAATPAPASVPEPPAAPKSVPSRKSKKENTIASASAPAPAPADGGDPEKIETWKFNEAKRKAQEDSQIQELKEKADNASEEDVRKALRAYNKALYNKMRELDPSIKDRIDGTEAALLKKMDQAR